MGLNFIAVNNPETAILDEGFDLVPLFEITETAKTITDTVYSFLQSPESMVAELNAMVFGAGMLGEWVLTVLSNSLYNIIIGSFWTNIPYFDELYNSAVDVTGRAHSILDILAFFTDPVASKTEAAIIAPTVSRLLGPDENYCRSCGKIIKKETEICIHCGVRQKNSHR
jgi:hypothetical protein